MHVPCHCGVLFILGVYSMWHRFLYSRLIFQLQWVVTYCMFKLTGSSNLLTQLFNVTKLFTLNFKSLAQPQGELWLVKVEKLDEISFYEVHSWQWFTMEKCLLRHRKFKSNSSPVSLAVCILSCTCKHGRHDVFTWDKLLNLARG